MEFKDLSSLYIVLEVFSSHFTLFLPKGIAATISWILWTILVSSTPAENRFINKKEKVFIQRILKGQEVSSATNKVC